MKLNGTRLSKTAETNHHSRLEEQPARHLSVHPSTLSEGGEVEGGLELGRLVEVVRRRLPIILGVTSLVLVATVVWNRTRPPAYEGSFKILIEPVTAESQVVSSLSGNATKAENQDLGNATLASKETLDYPTQIQILTSPKILTPVVQKLQASDPTFSYGKLMGLLKVSRQKEPAETKILEVQYHSTSGPEVDQVIKLLSQAYIRYSLTERQTNVRRAVQFVDEQLPKVQKQVKDVEASLQRFREQNQLVDPTVLGTQIGTQISTTQSQLIANQVELAQTRQLYNSLEKQLQLQPKGAEAATVLTDAPGYQDLVKQLQTLDVELQTQSAALTEDNPKVIDLREKRAKLVPLLQQKAEAALGKNLSKNFSQAQTLPYQNPLRQELSKQYVNASIQLQVLESKQNGLSLARQRLALQSSQLPALSRQYENLTRTLQLSTDQLNKFLQKREELMINAARQEVPWELVSPPSMQKVTSASLLRDLVLGTLLGGLLGFGVALLVDKMNDVIYTVKDLRSELKIAILGMIPQREELQKVKVQPKSFLSSKFGSKFSPTLNSKNFNREDFTFSSETPEQTTKNVRYQFSPFAEAFRSLYTQIRLLNPDSPVRSLVISSSVSGEGKTTIATQLAKAAAAMGQRVLLVDADLRKPSLQELRIQDSRDGLTDVITDRLNLMDVVRPMPDETNLYVLLSGLLPLDPTSLLGSQKMQMLMESCQSNFDLIIYDTAPLNFADSLLLVPQTDGLLLVARLGDVHRETLQNAVRLLDTSQVPVLGLVVNMVNDHQFSAGASYPQQIKNY
jgi:polysaccharide biosynthesis transport protein